MYERAVDPWLLNRLSLRYAQTAHGRSRTRACLQVEYFSENSAERKIMRSYYNIVEQQRNQNVVFVYF